jgi:hypothetical protein
MYGWRLCKSLPDSAARSRLCGTNPLLSLGAATLFHIANFLPPPEVVPPQNTESALFLIH